MPYPTSSKKKAPAKLGIPSGFCSAAYMMKCDLLCLARGQPYIQTCSAHKLLHPNGVWCTYGARCCIPQRA